MTRKHRRSAASAPMTRLRCITVGLALSVSMSLGAIHASGQEIGTSADVSERHAQAVRWARDGHYADAIDLLEQLRAEAPHDLEILYDEIVILGWAGRDAELIQLVDPLEPGALPLPVKLAAAKAQRNLRDFGAAQSWYRHALEQDAGSFDARLGLALTAADAGDFETARDAFAAMTPKARSSVEARLAQAYLFERMGELMAALDAYGGVLAIDPGQHDALRGKALVLRSLLLPSQALQLAKAHPGILTDEEIARLEVDEMAVQIRLTARTPYPIDLELERSSETLALLDAYLKSNTDPAARSALVLDRIVALADANRAPEAITAFESLPDTVPRPVPPYVLAAAAKAYVQVHRPVDALHVLESAVRTSPDEIELEFALVYTYLDLDRFKDAFELIAELEKEVPMFNGDADSPTRKGNPNWLRTKVVDGVAEAYGDQLERSQQHFETLLAEAPNNLDVRQELANVYRWRGWLGRSLSEYRQVLTIDPDLLSARLGYTYARLDARQFQDVEKAVDDMQAHYGTDPGVQQLAEQWRIHNKSELSIDASSGRSSGTTFGSKYYTVDTRWYTRPIAYRIRGLVRLHDAYAEFPEGDSRKRRLGLGAEYKAERWIATGELSASRQGGAGGLRGLLDWRITDQWSLAGVLDLNSDETPLRAHRVGIQSDVAGVSARFEPEESNSASFGWRYQDLSDGNSILRFDADGRHRIVNRPRIKLDLVGELFASTSEHQDVVYFSPARDLGIYVGAVQRWRLFHRYEHSLVQTAALRVGQYDEAGFPSGRLWRLGYSLEWRASDVLTLSVGAERARQFYDGAAEYATTLAATVYARF